jgi:putative membrane protein insertion efficiency factor
VADPSPSDEPHRAGEPDEPGATGEPGEPGAVGESGEAGAVGESGEAGAVGKADASRLPGEPDERGAAGEADEPGAGEGGGCRGPGGRATQAAAGAGEAGSATGRAVVPVPHAEPDDGHVAPAPGPRHGWRRLVPRRPWRWLGGIAALAALGSLAVGVLVVWLTRRPGHGATAPPGAGHPSGADPSTGPTPTGAPPSGTPWTPGTGGHPTGADPTGVGGGPTGTDSGSCSVEGVNCDPVGKGCDSACNGAGADCNRQLDDACAGPSCGSSNGCSGSDPNCGGDCSSTGHTLLTSLVGAGLPYLHHTATAPTAAAFSRTATGGAPRLRVSARAGVAAIRAYQRISPGLPTRCRYTPTCSRYGLAAIERYGLLTGARLAVLRIHRCTADVVPGTADPLPA